MSLLDELAGGDVDLDDLKISDLGVDVQSLGWQQSDDGTLIEVMKEDDKYVMNTEEKIWLQTVLDSVRKIHAAAIVRLYTAKQGEQTWTYKGLYGCVALVTEADLKMACAHSIRIVDLDGFNPNTSVILHQELYMNFRYHVLTPWFHAFEMNKYMAGLSFASEDAAAEFHRRVEEVKNLNPVDVVDEILDSKEKTYKMVGDTEWRQVGDSMSVKIARKYADGQGITDGTEVSWKKKKDLPPELAALLGEAGVQVEAPPTPQPVAPKGKDQYIDLKATAVGGSVSDGISVTWKKNTKALTSDNSQTPAVTPPTESKKKKEKKSLFSFGSKK